MTHNLPSQRSCHRTKNSARFGRISQRKNQHRWQPFPLETIVVRNGNPSTDPQTAKYAPLASRALEISAGTST
jgi:hypothetical protein